MPRISPRLFWKARDINQLLPSLLPVCRDLRSAQNELRWLGEHARVTANIHGFHSHDLLFRQFVKRRARGEPLQYVLGSEYFGDLEIQCRPGVLIPRQETAASVTYLVHRLSSILPSFEDREGLRVLDLCTGTGCIPLLFHHEFYSNAELKDVKLHLTAVDISPKALALAELNKLSHLENVSPTSKPDSPRLRSLQGLKILHADVLRRSSDAGPKAVKPVLEALQQTTTSSERPKVDILISNPPYISRKHYLTTTARSVRNFEPKLALVPPSPKINTPSNDSHDGDIFYPRLLRLTNELNARVFLLEVADMEQAQRVAALAVQQGIWEQVEIWRDEPASGEGVETIVLGGEEVRVRGMGNGRSVFGYRRGTRE